MQADPGDQLQEVLGRVVGAAHHDRVTGSAVSSSNGTATSSPAQLVVGEVTGDQEADAEHLRGVHRAGQLGPQELDRRPGVEGDPVDDLVRRETAGRRVAG